MIQKSKSIQLLKKHFRKNKITTMPELLDLLNVTARMTIFRRLSELDHLSSYSHRGQYYTLPSVILFNNQGLYHYDVISFSKYGNLKKTIIKLIENSNSGYTHKQLKELLKLDLHDTLLILIKAKQLSRQKIDGHYIYFCASKADAKKQLAERKSTGILRRPNNEISKLLIIEILVSIIRSNQVDIDLVTILSDLKIRKIATTEDEVEQVLCQLHLKKTLD